MSRSTTSPKGWLAYYRGLIGAWAKGNARPHDAEDAAQESAVSLLCKGPAAVWNHQAYLFRSTQNRLINEVRRQSRQEFVSLEELRGALDVVYNAQRDEIITTHRGVSRDRPHGTGAVTIIDGATYDVKRTIDLPVHPNSLALTRDGGTLYVTVKAPHGEEHPAWRKDALDSVVRIDLR